jgi:hypothetical protein
MFSETEADTPDLCRDLEADTPALCRDTPPIRTGDDWFNWAPENEEVVVAGSPPLAIYVNRWGQIVLRSDSYSGPGAGCGMDEQVIYLNPRDVDAVIDRLRQLADEVLGLPAQGPSK